MVWLASAVGFGALAVVLWRFIGPGPRWPLLLLAPVAVVSLLYLANHLMAGPDRGQGLDLFLAGPGGNALFALRFVSILLALVLARGARLVTAAALALLSLDAGLVFGVLSLFQCAACGIS